MTLIFIAADHAPLMANGKQLKALVAPGD